MSSNKKIKVLHLASSERWTGIAEPVTSLVKHQCSSGEVQAWLACIPGRSFERRARERGVEVLDLLSFHRKYNPISTIRDIRRLQRFVLEHTVDIVHCHLSHDHWLAAAALRFFRRIPVLLIRSYHRFVAPYRDPFHRWLYENATDLLITPTQALGDVLKSRMDTHDNVLRVVHGAVDTQRFNPDIDGSPIRERAKISPGAPVAGLVARLRKDRGIFWLMKSIPLVLEKHPNAYFIFVGRGELKYWLLDYINKIPHGNRILRAGYQTTALPQFYAAFDCSLFLGLGSDGSSRAVLEAMASATPVIALNSGGLDEVIEHGKNGLLVEPQDVDGLADAISQLFSDKARRDAMGREARKTIIQRFTEERRAADTLDIYRHLLGEDK